MSDLPAWSAGNVPHVLYVGDESERREDLRSALAGKWAMESAEDGIQGIDLLQHEQRPERIVIILDLGMPVLEGLGFEKARRADPRIAHLPVVLVTAHAADSRMRKFGAQAYVQRPVSLEALIETIERLGAF